MRILISSYTLDLSGVPTYTLTLFNELKKRGYEVQVFSPKSGYLSPRMDVCTDPNDLRTPDIILGQHRECAQILKDTYPDIPMIYFIHHPEYPEEKPPDFECRWYISIHEETNKSLMEKGIPFDKITIVRDFIDTEKFRPITPINATLKNVLYVSNRKKWRTYDRIKKACEVLNLNFRAVGSPYGRARAIEEDINKADLVVGWARCLMESMSCGRPVISYDKEFGDGYLDYETYLKSRTYNFGPGGTNQYTVDGLIEELKKYDPKDGEINRKIVLQEHNVVYGTDQIISLIRRIL